MTDKSTPADAPVQPVAPSLLRLAMEALKLYEDAGFGQSTDPHKQGEAYDAGTEAISAIQAELARPELVPLSDARILWHAGDHGICMEGEPDAPDRDNWTFTREAVLEFARAIEARALVAGAPTLPAQAAAAVALSAREIELLREIRVNLPCANLCGTGWIHEAKNLLLRIEQAGALASSPSAPLPQTQAAPKMVMAEPQWGLILDELDSLPNDSRDEFEKLGRLIRQEHERSLDRLDRAAGEAI